jgi:hypothetical protein
LPPVPITRIDVLAIASAAQAARADRPALYDNRESAATPLIVRFFVRSADCERNAAYAEFRLAPPAVQLAVLQYAALPLYDKPLGNEQRSAEAGVMERWDLRHVDAP